jgi:hypothetical protein
VGCNKYKFDVEYKAELFSIPAPSHIHVVWTALQNTPSLKVYKNKNYIGFDFEFCTISLLVMLKY